MGKLGARGLICGDWLDVGCAEGYWSVALAERGARTVVGVEVDPSLINAADLRPHPATVSFRVAPGEALPFPNETFDGVLVNEVLEHVADEKATLKEVARVLRPGGHLALFAPNRWFPFEGHGARLDEQRSLVSRPVPLMPWLPSRLTRRFATARNYWPHELRDLVTTAGLIVEGSDWALIQFGRYPWMPRRMIAAYHSAVPRLERSLAGRFFAVSTLVIARARGPGDGREPA